MKLLIVEDQSMAAKKAQLGEGRREEVTRDVFGETMIICGIAGMLIAGIGAMRRDHGHR